MPGLYVGVAGPRTRFERGERARKGGGGAAGGRESARVGHAGRANERRVDRER